MAPKLNTHDFMMPNGKHRGERITRIPLSYLKWMVNERHSLADYAQAELGRRGVSLEGQGLDISGHAIDGASLRVRDTWHKTRGPDEGLHAWLLRLGQEALEKGTESEPGKRTWQGVVFVFETSGVWPVLKTVMRAKPEPIYAGEDGGGHDPSYGTLPKRPAADDAPPWEE